MSINLRVIRRLSWFYHATRWNLTALNYLDQHENHVNILQNQQKWDQNDNKTFSVVLSDMEKFESRENVQLLWVFFSLKGLISITVQQKMKRMKKKITPSKMMKFTQEVGIFSPMSQVCIFLYSKKVCCNYRQFDLPRALSAAL